jgi:multidrug resistance efflux pump
MKRVARILATLIIVAAACASGYKLWDYYMLSPWTRDARVRADVVTIAPEVAGKVIDLRVKDNQFVHKGDELFEIDPADYRIALDHALAQEQHDMALLDYARANERRKASLVPQGTVSKDTYQQTTSALGAAEAAVALDEAAIAKARLDLSRTVIRAPVNGFITNLTLVAGQYASVGTKLMALIDRESYRIEAYFEETKMPAVDLGVRVDIHLMNGEPALRGHVESISRGIMDRDNTSGPELLANVTPTFEWVRLAQRIPVRIHVDHVPEGVLISSGMTCTVQVEAPPRPWATAGLLHEVASYVTKWLSLWRRSQALQ